MGMFGGNETRPCWSVSTRKTSTVVVCEPLVTVSWTW
jgi:hypothetical protein